MTTATARRRAPANETAKAVASAPDRDNIAPLRVIDLNKVYRDSYGLILPPDEAGKYACHVWLLHQARTGAGAERRMDNFLEFRAPWMSAENREAEKEAAFASTKFYGADELAIAFGITYAKRTALGLTTIGSTDIDAAQRKAIRKEKQLNRQREWRLRERLRRKQRSTEPSKRAAAIAQMLPSAEWFDVVAICSELRRKKVIPFAALNADALRVAVHRAVDFGVASGLFYSRKEPGPNGSSMTRQVRKRSQ